MSVWSEPTAAADLEAIIGAVMASPIRLQPASLAERLADWENTRHAEDVDEVVLAWIASHVRGRRPASLS